jgi:hypothetical protein
MTTPHTAAGILRLARAKIDTPEKWTQGAPARDMLGSPVDFDTPDATAWCALAAIETNAADYRQAREILLRAARAESIINWNDSPSRTHAEVLAAFSRAIELAEAQP